MKKALLTFAAAFACVIACLLCTSCAPSAADEARSLIESGDIAGAIEKADGISDQTEKQAVLKEAVVKAMDAQKVLDTATEGFDAVDTLTKNYSATVKSKLLSAAFSALTGEGDDVSLEVDTSDSSYKAAIQQGEKISEMLSEYTAAIPTSIQSELDEDTKTADEKYRNLCSALASFLSDSGLQIYLYSSDVLGTQLGTSTASVTPQTLKDRADEFTTAYKRIEDAAGSSTKK